MKFCDSAKNSVEATNARYAEEDRRQQEEKQKRETISSAVQHGNAVNVYGLSGNLLFTVYGTLKGYTNSTVSVEYNGYVRTYNGRGNAIY